MRLELPDGHVCDLTFVELADLNREVGEMLAQAVRADSPYGIPRPNHKQQTGLRAFLDSDAGADLTPQQSALLHALLRDPSGAVGLGDLPVRSIWRLPVHRREPSDSAIQKTCTRINRIIVNHGLALSYSTRHGVVSLEAFSSSPGPT